MKNLGILAEPFGGGSFFFSQNFALAKDEADELISRLRKVGMDTFKGGSIPQMLLPENLPGNPLAGLDLEEVTEVYHSELESWKVQYREIIKNLGKGPDREKALHLSPVISFQLDSSSEAHILNVHPFIMFHLDLEGGIRTYVNFQRKNEFIDIVHAFVQDQYTLREIAFSKTGDGWEYSPIIATRRIIPQIEHVARNVTIEDLRRLEALVNFTRKTGNAYSSEEIYAQEVAISAVRKEYYAKHQEILARLNKASKPEAVSVQS